MAAATTTAMTMVMAIVITDAIGVAITIMAVEPCSASVSAF